MSNQPISVAINTTALLSTLTGVGRYVHSLCAALQDNQNIRLRYFYGHRWFGTLQPLNAPHKTSRTARWFAENVPTSRTILRSLQEIQFSRGVRDLKPQVFHEPAFSSLRFDGPTVLTVHDLSWIHFPETHPRGRVKFLERHFEKQLIGAEQIITDSEYVKAELTQMFGLPAHRIQAIHLASEPLFRPRNAQETQATRADFGLEHGKYWLSVGTLEPRKNLHTLLDAFAMLPTVQRRQCPLILIGLLGWRYADLLPRLDEMTRAGEVRYLGYLSREAQANLLAGARALVYPSIYEGFGLPLVEAMQSGVPVIASDASCLPEVLGGAGCLFQAQDASGLCDHFKQLLNDDALLETLRTRGLSRSRAFDWTRCAQQTVKVYRRAIGFESSF